MEGVAIHSSTACTFTMVFDDRCAVVGRLARLVKIWDRRHHFNLIGRSTGSNIHPSLLEELDDCPWSLLLIDDLGERWSGPDAVPMILKNLPFGKIAAVAYIVPGTMWLTQKLYLLVSRNHRRFA
jgi:predicted DCC family thiol-disulfide oxidoreductase YuxK